MERTTEIRARRGRAVGLECHRPPRELHAVLDLDPGASAMSSLGLAAGALLIGTSEGDGRVV